jgi:hypothetical protein
MLKVLFICYVWLLEFFSLCFCYCMGKFADFCCLKYCVLRGKRCGDEGWFWRRKWKKGNQSYIVVVKKANLVAWKHKAVSEDFENLRWKGSLNHVLKVLNQD